MHGLRPLRNRRMKTRLCSLRATPNRVPVVGYCEVALASMKNSLNRMQSCAHSLLLVRYSRPGHRLPSRSAPASSLLRRQPRPRSRFDSGRPTRWPRNRVARSPGFECSREEAYSSPTDLRHDSSGCHRTWRRRRSSAERDRAPMSTGSLTGCLPCSSAVNNRGMTAE